MYCQMHLNFREICEEANILELMRCSLRQLLIRAYEKSCLLPPILTV